MSNTITTTHFNSPVGKLILGSYNHKICLCDWQFRAKRTSIDNRLRAYFNANYTTGINSLLTKTINELDAYFNQTLEKFSIPTICAGSEFQKRVWRALQEIPYGSTSTYLKLSQKLANKKAIRAIAGANGANAISIIIPCHRIIGSDGSLVGYAGGLKAKQKLLQLENPSFGQQMSLF